MDTKVFEVTRSEGYFTLSLFGALDAESAKVLEKDALPKLLEEPFLNVLVNCEALSQINPHGMRILLGIQRKIASLNKQLRLISATEDVLEYINQQGLKDSLPCSNSAREALVAFGLLTPKALDVNFINPFLTATMNALKVQASTESKAGKLFRRDPKESFLGDISGIIGLISEAFSGSVVISFPEKTFLAIMSRMIGEECTEMTKDIQDGAGELTNIIFGQAKVVLNEKGYGIKTAIPSVVTGKDHSVLNISRGPRVTVPFTTDVGDFFIEICLSE